MKRALTGLVEAVDAMRHLPEIERILEARFATLLEHFGATTKAVEALVPLLERQGETTALLLPPLEANEAATEKMHEELVTVREGIEVMHPDIAAMRAGIETMHPDIAAMRKAMESMNDNLEEIRNVVEPLASATSRVGRFSDRHPGSSQK